LNFTSSDWTPITLKVKAIDDSVVQDPNKQVFAEQTRVTSRIQGALYLYGGGGDGSLVGTTSQTLPYEQDVPVTHGAADFKVNTDPATGKVTTTEIEITFSKVPKEFRIDPDDEASLFDIAKFNASTRANSIGLVNGELGQFWGIASAAYTDGTGADKSKVTFICDRFHGMDLSQPSDLPFDDGDAVSMSHMSNNFYVDETTQSDRIYINNQESVAQDESGSINRLTDDLKGNTASSLAAEMAAAGGLRVSGLGMAAGITNGSPTFFDMDNPGGIMFQDMEQAEVNLGANGNYFTVNATLADGIRKTATVVNGGSGVDHLGIGSLKKETKILSGLSVGAFTLGAADPAQSRINQAATLEIVSLAEYRGRVRQDDIRESRSARSEMAPGRVLRCRRRWQAVLQIRVRHQSLDRPGPGGRRSRHQCLRR
jgi:hypothetical protein